MTPRISILLPVRDAASTLAVALRSIERQRESDFECVIVDDGSRDASPEIARRFAARDGRFHVVAQPREGLVVALQTGLARCRGELVARMDADDWMHRDRLAMQHEALRRSASLVGVGCHVRVFPRLGDASRRRAYEAWLGSIRSPDSVRREAFVECPLAHPTWMIRREALRQEGYRDVGWPEDYDLLLRLLARGAELGVVPRRLLGWRDAPDRLSRTHAAYEIGRFTDCKAHHLARGFLARDARYVLWGYGGTGRTLRAALEREGRTPSHIVELHPGRLGQRIHGAPVVPPEALRELPRAPIVVSVAGPEPRRRIRAALEAMGFCELRDFVCAA